MTHLFYIDGHPKQLEGDSPGDALMDYCGRLTLGQINQLSRSLIQLATDPEDQKWTVDFGYSLCIDTSANA